MNHPRVLRIMNWMLLSIGYQLHWFDRKSSRFGLSLWILSYFCSISLFYVICFAHHFETSSLLHLLKNVSPFLYRLLRLQLLFCLKVFLFSIYEIRMSARAINELTANLPKINSKRFTRDEAFAYFLIFSTVIVAFILALYVAYEMDFKLPPLDDILIFCGVFIPHSIIGGALKLFNVGIWLMRSQLSQLELEFMEKVSSMGLEDCTKVDVEKANVTLGENGNAKELERNELKEITLEVNRKINLNFSLQEIYKPLLQLSKAASIFNRIMHRQLVFLIFLNSTCLLAGSYTRVYYESTWKEIFLRRTQRVFQATNCSIFILIIWDYMTLCLTQGLFERVRLRFIKSVQEVIKRGQNFTITTRFLLSDINNLLKENFILKFQGTQMGFSTFLVLQVFVGLTISLIVIYHYLDDQIRDLTERFDTADEDDDDK